MATVVYKKPNPEWRTWEQRLDRMVDTYLSEQVVIYPMAGGSYTQDGDLDPNRNILDTVGVFEKQSASTVALAQAFAGGGGGGKLVEQETWVSIQQDLLPSLTYYKAHDVLYFPLRNETYEILYIAPSDTFRPRLYLARLNPDHGPPTDLLPDP